MTHSLIGLKIARQLSGFRAADLAERIGITVDSYRRVERGERRCYFDKVLILAEMLGVPVDQLAREPTEEERVAMFAAGERRRALLATSGGDVELAETLAGWVDEGDDA